MGVMGLAGLVGLMGVCSYTANYYIFNNNDMFCLQSRDSSGHCLTRVLTDRATYLIEREHFHAQTRMRGHMRHGTISIFC